MRLKLDANVLTNDVTSDRRVVMYVGKPNLLFHERPNVRMNEKHNDRALRMNSAWQLLSCFLCSWELPMQVFTNDANDRREARVPL